MYAIMPIVCILHSEIKKQKNSINLTKMYNRGSNIWLSMKKDATFHSKSKISSVQLDLIWFLQEIGKNESGVVHYSYSFWKQSTWMWKVCNYDFGNGKQEITDSMWQQD